MTMTLRAVTVNTTGDKEYWREVDAGQDERSSHPNAGPSVASRNDDSQQDAQLNVSNRNMAALFEALWLPLESDGALISVETFLAHASRWLQQHIDSPSQRIDPSIEAGKGGSVLVFGGLRPGYLNEKIHTAVLIAQRGKAAGATHILVD